MERQKYYIVNLNCDNEHYELMLTQQEYQGIMEYYNIMDKMKIADLITPPLTEQEYKQYIEE